MLFASASIPLRGDPCLRLMSPQKQWPSYWALILFFLSLTLRQWGKPEAFLGWFALAPLGLEALMFAASLPSE